MTRAVVIAVLCAAGLAAEPRAQNPEAAARNPTGATLSGRVVADATGAPVANARIVISAAGHGSTIAVSDRDGVFTFAPPDPSFALVAAKSGYVQARMTSGAAASDVVLRLVRSCVVSGRVIDASGEPVVDAMIAVSEAPAGQGPTRPLARGDTDDAGDFRIAGIAPGAVVVSVTTASGMEVTRTLANQILASPRIATVFYPRAATKAEAEVIALEPGDERSDVDFVVAADQGGLNAITSSFYVMPKPRTAGGTSTIGGRVFATDGRPVAAAYVRLLGATGFTPVASARTDAAGRFAFADLDAGRYRVAAGKPGFTAADAAEAGMPAPPPYGFSPWIDLKADESRARIDLQLVRLGSVSGVLFDETGEPVQGASVQLLRVRFDRGRRRLVGVGLARPTDDR